MNRTAYFTTDLAIKTLAKLIKAKTVFHGLGNIPDGPTIFVINHFTRIETLLLPYYLHHLTKTPIWSLADDGLFKGALKPYFDRVGVVSTRHPQRDQLIIKTLITGNAHWIIFPEGRMVKNKKLIRKGKYLIGDDHTIRTPHTGAASLALRAEIFRRFLLNGNSGNALLRTSLEIDEEDAICTRSMKIVPVNITYYPIRAQDNFFSDIAVRYMKDPSDRMLDELMTEGSMILDGVDIDVSFGLPIDTAKETEHPVVAALLEGPATSHFDDSPKSIRHLQKRAGAIMQLYMERIYSHTTINHDHLFASLLRKRSFKPFEADSLARSAFLAAHYIGRDKTLGKNLHTELEMDQNHLLVDDHFGKLCSFLDTGVESTCLIPIKKRYKKNPLCWKQPSLFHRARIENPIEVMANEVEPLRLFQKYLRRVSLLPDFLVRILTARLIYLKDRNNYRAEREACGKEHEFEYRAGRPFLLSAGSCKTGVVLVHSYLSVPQEVRRCAVAINRQGYWVYGVRLPGHGTNPERLAEVRREDWQQAVERGYAMVHALCRKVVVVGFSVGGVLALELSSRLEKCAGVAAVCPPYELKNYSKRFMPSIDIWNRLLTKWKGDSGKSSFFEFEPEQRELNYNRNPISGVYEIGELLDCCRKRLPDIKHRSMIVSVERDQVVGDQGRPFFEKIGSEEKKLVTVSGVRHSILNGPDSSRIERLITTFVKECD